MADLSQYSDEEIESMLKEYEQVPQAEPAVKTQQPDSDLSQYSDEQIQSMLDQQSLASQAKQEAAAFATGVGKGVPFGQDIPAALGTALSYAGVGPRYVPTEGTMGERFTAAKKAQEKAYEQTAEKNPLTSAAGQLTGIVGSIPAFEVAAPAEAMVASKAVPALEQTIGRIPMVGKFASEAASEIGGGALKAGYQTGIYGLGEGVTPEERLKKAYESGVSGAKIGAFLPALARATGLNKLTEAEKAAMELEAPMPASVGATHILPRTLSEALFVSPITKGQMAKAVEEGKEALGQALINKGEFVPDLTHSSAGKSAKNALSDWVNVEMRNRSKYLYDQVEDFVNSDRARASIISPLSETKTMYRDISLERLEAALGKDSPAMKEIQKAVFRPGMTYSGIKRLRTEFDDLLNSMRAQSLTGQAEARRIRDALTKDLENAAENAGGPLGRRAFEIANSEYKKLSDTRDKIYEITGKDFKTKDEAVYETLAKAAKRTGGNSELLKAAKDVMRPDAWRDVVSMAAEELGRKKGQSFIVDDFVNGYNNLSKEGKDLLFGPSGNPQRDVMEKIYKVSKRYVDAGRGNHYSKLSLAALNSLAIKFLTYGAGAAGVIANWQAAVAAGALSIPIASVFSYPRLGSLYADYLSRPTAENLKKFTDAGIVYLNQRSQRNRAQQDMEERPQRAFGGKIDKRDYPAKKLSRVEKALKRAQDALAMETKPIMNVPDEAVAQALHLAKDK